MVSNIHQLNLQFKHNLQLRKEKFQEELRALLDKHSVELDVMTDENNEPFLQATFNSTPTSNYGYLDLGREVK